MIYDTIIIGSGPAGTTAAIYLKRANKNVLVIEKAEIGGQVAIAGLLENYPGFEKIEGQALALKFKEHLESLNVPIFSEEVKNVSKEKNLFLVKTMKNTYQAKSVIVSVGAKPKELGLKEEKSLIGYGLSYCVYCDGALYKNANVAVIGGGYSATEAALYLSKIAKNVFLINEYPSFRAEEITLSQIKKAKNIKIYNEAKVLSFSKDENNLLSKVTFLQKNKQITEPVYGAFVYIGRVPEISFLNNLNVSENGYIKTNLKLETSIEGLFAAGDCRLSDYKQVSTAVGDGAIVSFSCADYLKKQG